MADLMIFREQPIRERGEMLNLTDMWRGSGEDSSKRPVDWLRSKQSREFRGFLETVGISHSLEVEAGNPRAGACRRSDGRSTRASSGSSGNNGNGSPELVSDGGASNGYVVDCATR